jgi:uncharacterized membrane protein YccC
MNALRSPVRALAAFDPHGLSLLRGVRGALGCCVPLLAAQWFRDPALSWAALIGFWVALVDPGWPPRSRIVTIGAFIAGSAAGCFLAILLRPHIWPSGAFALVWCLAAILTRIWGDTAGSTGNLVAIATLIVLGTDQPSSATAAAEMAMVTIGGGLWGLLLAFCIGGRRPEAPLRAALAAVFRAEAAFVRDLVPQQQYRGAVREAIEHARGMLVSARRQWFGGSMATQSFGLLLSDAEGVLRALLALREALNDGSPTEAPAVSALADRLDATATALTDGRPIAVIASPVHAGDDADAVAVALHAATGWIAAAQWHLADPPDWAAASCEPEAVQPTNRLRQLRDNLNTESLSLRHAARFALTGAALTMLVKGLHIDMGYWITITAVIILQAYPSATWQRAIQRVGGTVLGGLIAAGTAFFLHGPAAIVIVVIPLSLLSMAFRGVSYALYIVCITPLFILITELVNHGGVLSPALGELRILDNLVGAAIGMLATFMLWPSWEAHFLRRRLAEDLRANARFLMAALDAWLGTATLRETDDARRQAGLAGNNAEASLRRTMDEPRRHPSDQIAAAMAITAAARRLAGMAALVVQSPPVPEAMARIAGIRPYLQGTAEAAADAIEHGRAPAAGSAKTLPHRSQIEILLNGVLRQLSVVSEAARRLAVPERPFPSPRDPGERSTTIPGCRSG